MKWFVSELGCQQNAQSRTSAVGLVHSLGPSRSVSSGIQEDWQKPLVKELRTPRRGHGKGSCRTVPLGERMCCAGAGPHPSAAERRTSADSRGDWLSHEAHPLARFWAFHRAIATGPGQLFPLVPRDTSGEEDCLSCFRSNSMWVTKVVLFCIK